MASHRIDRLNTDIRRELAQQLTELKDPRIDGMISVMRVEATEDLSYAKVLIGSINGYKAAEEACTVLKKASGFLRNRLSKNLKIRKAPELTFVPDDSAEYFEKINTIIEGF